MRVQMEHSTIFATDNTDVEIRAYPCHLRLNFLTLVRFETCRLFCSVPKLKHYAVNGEKLDVFVNESHQRIQSEPQPEGCEPNGATFRSRL